MGDQRRDETTEQAGETPTVRMMVLETDEPHHETQSRRGTFGSILHKHFTDAGAAHDPPLGIETDRRFVVTEKGGTMPKLEDFESCHALLITGSVYDAHGDVPWILELLELLKKLWIHHPDMHFSGVCFGHQLLCRMLGATIRPSPTGDWELGHSKVSLHPVGKKLFRTDDDAVYLHQMHQDHVVAPPTPETAGGLLRPGEKVEVWGYSEHTAVQGVYIRGRMFTTQAHLAFDEGMVKRQIEMRVESGSLEDGELADQAKETGALETDGDLVAGAILSFFHGEDEGIE
ncbi:putative glutamine amidotransferase [Echria macrotheca]|uniref:Glutamine amidotransferase n=1 Tax=Echria macrotheca TaxID=438768 RepID=A0AAJ0FE23_9PEZI|nr:putative glutamine amidotransferase [Echria macrotheca]